MLLLATSSSGTLQLLIHQWQIIGDEAEVLSRMAAQQVQMCLQVPLAKGPALQAPMSHELEAQTQAVVHAEQQLQASVHASSNEAMRHAMN